MSGRLMCTYINGFNLSVFFQDVAFGRTKETIDATTARSRAKRFVDGLPDSAISGTGLWDGQAGAIDQVLDKALSGNARSNFIWYPHADTFGKIGYGALCIDTSHDVSGGVEDAVSTAYGAQPTETGRERLVSLYPGDLALLLAASPFTGSTHNFGVATALGGAGYLQVFTLDGTGTLDVEIHASDDNFAADDDTIITFTQQSATSGVITTTPHQRSELADDFAMKQWTRIEATLTGATRALFAVGLNRREALFV
jgi:hypothetical protein